MSDNLTIFKGEYEKLKGQHVISNDKVYRFIGIVDDEFDYYYCLYDGRKLYLHSCVGRVTPLKSYILDDHYAEFIRLAKINHYDQVDLYMNKDHERMEEFNIKHKEHLLEDLVFISGPCWDLN